jgi:hypothetical protein
MTMPWNIAGTLIGNALFSKTVASWRWCYYLAITYGVISFIGTVVFYFPPVRPQRDYEKSRWQEIKEIDYIGVSLYTLGLTVFLVGLAWAGTPEHPWGSASVIAPIVTGLAVFIGAFIYDFTLAKEPFFPFRLFRQVREFTVLLIVVFVAGMIFYSMAGLLPQGSLHMFTNDPTEIGIIGLPNGVSQFIAGAVLPSFAGKIKNLRTQVVVALVLQTLFVALYSVVIPNNKAAWMAFQVFGMGPFSVVTLLAYIIAGLHVSQKDLGVASGLIGTFRSAGGSVGIAIFGTILNGAVSSQLATGIANAGVENGATAAMLELLIPATINNAVGVPGAFASVPGITPAIEAAAAVAYKEAYAYAFRRVFWASIPFGIIAIIAACFIKDPSKYLTNHVAVRMEKEGFGGRVSHMQEDDHHAPTEKTSEKAGADSI